MHILYLVNNLNIPNESLEGTSFSTKALQRATATEP